MKYYILLQLCLGQGNKKVKAIFENFSSCEEIFKLSKEQLTKSGFFSKLEVEKILNTPLVKAEEILKQCKAENIKLIPFGKAGYPVTLTEIFNPPILLFVKGEMPDFETTPSISIVGPRNVSEFGKKSAYSLGYRLAKSGMVVVSGGAVGADTYAHIGALKAGGKTVLVMGCGLTTSYLEENRALREHIASNGCLISEYPPKTPATRYSFPMRNRIIAALTLGTVVVEAKEGSGALITANLANEQGKDVFVIPGSPASSEYKGSNALLRDGAKPLLDVTDIFNEYIPLFPDKINIERAFKKEPKSQPQKNNKKILNETLSNYAKIVYNCLDKPKFYPDELDTSLNSSQLLSALTELEMEFIIRALPGGQYEICK